MPVHLPIAEMSVWAEQMLLLGAVVGFLSGVFGVGGGFLTTPFLIFLGLPPAVAVGTQACQLVASSVTGSLGHLRRGGVDVRMGTVMLAGGLVGSVVGIGIFRVLQHFGQIDLVLGLLYVAFLGGVGGLMLAESVVSAARRGRSKVRAAFNAHKPGPLAARLPWRMAFPRSRLYISALVPGGIGFVGGLMVSIMGIGGGFLLVPAMIYILGMPILLVAGTSLFQIVFTGAVAVVLHAVASGTVDIVLATLLIAGGLVGTRAGVWAARFITGAAARVTLALIILAVAVAMGRDLFIGPADPFSVVVR
jgi:uncharacterized protein